MPVADTITVGLLPGALVPTLALAQSGGNSGKDIGTRSTTRAAGTARSGAARPPVRAAAPKTTGSTGRGKSEPSGLSTGGICIGCTAQ